MYIRKFKMDDGLTENVWDFRLSEDEARGLTLSARGPSLCQNLTSVDIRF